MKKLAVVISATLMLSSVANAEFYLGGKVGKSWLDDACTSATANCDDESITAGLFAGYEFLDYLSLEGGYDYLGEFTADGIDGDNYGAKNNVDEPARFLSMQQTHTSYHAATRLGGDSMYIVRSSSYFRPKYGL